MCSMDIVKIIPMVIFPEFRSTRNVEMAANVNAPIQIATKPSYQIVPPHLTPEHVTPNRRTVILNNWWISHLEAAGSRKESNGNQPEA